MKLKQKTSGESQIATHLKCALTLRDASKEQIASNATTGQKNFTILRSIKRSFVRRTLTMLINVNMVKFVRLLMMNQNCLSHNQTKCKETLISTCFILKLCGVLLVTKNISVIYVFMLTTGKTLDAPHTNTNTLTHNVVAGKQKRILKLTKTDANLNIAVASVTDGKNQSTTLCVTRHQNAELLMVANVASLTVHFTIMSQRSDNLCLIRILNFSLKIEVMLMDRYFHM